MLQEDSQLTMQLPPQLCLVHFSVLSVYTITIISAAAAPCICDSSRRDAERFPDSLASKNFMVSSSVMVWFLSPNRSSWMSASERLLVTQSQITGYV